MKLLQLAGAAALCGVLLLTACAKKTDQSTTSTDNTTTQSAAATAAADATPAAAATTATTSTVTSGGTSVTTSSGNGKTAGYIDLPVYPGATESKDQGLSVSGNGVSVETKVFMSKDDAKSVSEWYKSHLPASWKNSIFTAGGKVGGTFVDEHADGDQSVLVTNNDDGSSRIQLTTKHGK